MGDNYSIADISLWPWVRALSKVYDAKQVLELESYHHITQWLNLCMERTGSVAVLTP
jgi:GST-like protein